MASWAEFGAAAPDLAETAERLLDGPGVVLLGTLRRDGWPRISPVEPVFTAGDLWLGMTLRSRKALDLRRDPRCLVHNAVADRTGESGEIKLRGRAVEVLGGAERERYADALLAKIGWRPEGAYHLFRLDLMDVGSVWREGEEQKVRRWVAAS